MFIEVLGPPEALLRDTASDIDNASFAVRIVCGSISFVMTVDTLTERERLMARNRMPIDGDILKVAHHGIRNSSANEFISMVSPNVAIISAGVDNRFDHPHQETLGAFAQYLPESRIFVTKDHDSVTVTTDGKSLTVNSGRSPLDGFLVR